MTEKKTAEEIVNKNDIDKGPPHWVTKKSAIKSCDEYAAQELAEYKLDLQMKIEDEMELEKKAAQIPGADVHPTGYYMALERMYQLIDKL